MTNGISRRTLLASLALATARRGAAAEKLPPVRAITQGPKYHWFGYYDKLQFDPGGRYVLGMQVGFEHRQPNASDAIRIGMVDLKDQDRWIDLGETKAWCWQQGCMLQWLPGSDTEVIYNDREGARFVSHILNVRTGKKRTLPRAIYAVGPDARWAVSTDFSRLNDTRPGYGYAGIPDPHKDDLAPEQSGIWRMNLVTGKDELIVSLAQAANFPYRLGSWAGSKHKFNHLLFSPDGSRFVFLHRRRGGSNPEAGVGRMFTANPDGTDLYVLDPYGRPSHFIWRDPGHVLCFAPHPSHGTRFYLYRDGTEDVEVVGRDLMTRDGHCSYLPGKQKILNDTYPDQDRLQHPYIYDVRAGTRHPLGHFFSPKEYTGPWRCDTHPRFSPDGRSVVIDSPHGGNGRQMYLIDVSRLIA